MDAISSLFLAGQRRCVQRDRSHPSSAGRLGLVAAKELLVGKSEERDDWYSKEHPFLSDGFLLGVTIAQERRI